MVGTIRPRFTKIRPAWRIPMVTDQNKAVYLRFIQEVFNEGSVG
jgi:hypothetical protein